MSGVVKKEIVNATDQLFTAAKSGDLATVKRLMKKLPKGSDTQRPSNLQTPLHVAALEGHFELVKYLVNKKTKIELKDKNGWTCFLCAVFSKYLDIAQWLLDCTPARADTPSSDNNTALHYLVRHPYTDKAKTLFDLMLSKGLNSNVQNKNGESALHCASARGADDWVSQLLRSGADPKLTNKLGETPLHDACRAGHAECVRILLKNGAEPTIQGTEGSARDVALTCKQLQIVNILDSSRSQSQLEASRKSIGPITLAPKMDSSMSEGSMYYAQPVFVPPPPEGMDPMFLSQASQFYPGQVPFHGFPPPAPMGFMPMAFQPPPYAPAPGFVQMGSQGFAPQGFMPPPQSYMQAPQGYSQAPGKGE